VRRKLSIFSLVIGVLLGSLSPARAALLTLTGSTLTFTVGYPLPVVIPQSVAAIPISVSSGAGGFSVPQGVFTGDAALPTALFTGVPIIHRFVFGNLSNEPLAVTESGGPKGGFGGFGGFFGTAFVNYLGLSNIAVPIGPIGVGGHTEASVGSFVIGISGTGWTTGAAVLKNVTATTPDGAVVNTVTRTGSDARTAGHEGTLTLVSPFRVLVGAADNLPGFAVQSLTFVPEPASLVLLGAGALTLVLLGSARRGG